MDLQECPVGSLIVAAIDEVYPKHDEWAFFKRSQVSGLTLFKRNVSDPISNTKKSIEDLQNWAHQLGLPPLIVAIDQEGGRVRRIMEPFPNQGPAMNLAGGLSTHEALQSIEVYGQQVASGLTSVGINVNFAPVVDVLSNEQNVAIGDRSFGRDAQAVTLRAGAFLNGLQRSGRVFGCLKHFPGQGAALFDTHLHSAVIDAAEDLLTERDLAPFQNLLSYSPMVMISHCIYPAWDEVHPASLSPYIMTTLLRDKLGYEGLIVSDDMNMEAIDQNPEQWVGALIEAVLAGADLLLICKHLVKCEWAYEGLRDEWKKSSVFRARVDDACQRIYGFRQRIKRLP